MTAKKSRGILWFSRVLFRVLVAFLLFLVLLDLAPPQFWLPIELIGPLTTGWFKFIARTLPFVSWNWDLVGMGVGCVLLILAGVHWFLNWLCRSLAASRPDLANRLRWPWRWTWCGLCFAGLFFVVGMAIGGMAHQIGWMASSREPWFESSRSRFEPYKEMRQIGVALSLALLESKNDLARARQQLRDPRGYLRDSPQILEKYHVLIFVNSNNIPGESLIFPRNREHRARLGGFQSSSQIREKALTNLLANRRSELVSF